MTAPAPSPYALFPEISTTEVDALLHRLTAPASPAAGHLTAPDRSSGSRPADSPWSPILRRLGRVPFVDLICDSIEAELQTIRPTLARHRHLLADLEAVATDLAKHLVDLGQSQLLRPAIGDLDEARRAGHLHGSTARLRFEDFSSRMRSPGARERFARRYPSSVGQARLLAAQAVEHTAALLTDLDTDRGRLCSVLGVSSGAQVRSLAPGAGDRHHCGRTVTHVEMTDGSRLVYKPRSSRIDKAYAEVLERLGRADPRLRLPVTAVVDADDHGWFELVDDTGAPARGEEFYRAGGVLLGVLHFLRANDLHYENFLAVDAAPVLVDVETVLGNVAVRLGAPPSPAALRLAETVNATGMLPTVMANPNQQLPGVDVGALGYDEGQVSPFKSLVVVDPFLDTMHMELRNLPQTGRASFPKGGLDVHEEVAALSEGFSRLYRWVTTHRHELATWVDELFDERVRTRVVLADTQRYGQLLRMATHPSLNGNPPSRDLVLHRIAIARDHVPSEVLRDEVRQMSRGDTPYFSVTARGTSLDGPDGRVSTGFLERSPVEQVLGRVARADEDDLALNLWVIRLSYVSRFPRDADRTGLSVRPDAERPSPPPSTVAALVRDLVAPVSAAAVHGSSTVPTTWIGAEISPDAFQFWRVGELGSDVYGGSPGVALAQAYLSPVLGTASLDLARRWAVPLIALLEDPRVRAGIVRDGAYTGIHGMVYSAAEIARLLADDELAARCARLWTCVVDERAAGLGLDVLSGAAGVLGAALGLAALAAPGLRAEYERSAARVADHVLARAGTTDLSGSADPALGYPGFAHGVIGVAAYLTAYGRLAGHDRTDPLVERLLHRADELIAQERRSGSEPIGLSWGWCHGIPGQLLGRAAVRRQSPSFADLELEGLSTRLLEEGFGHNVSLCHGDAGNLWVLAEVARATGRTELGTAASEGFAQLAGRALPELLHRSFNRHLLNHSLMLGRSGVALALAEQAELIPPTGVLWLAP